MPDGGAFDGPLGVVSAFAALDVLRADGFRPARPLGVACFGDEEGARFGVACAGSRILTGALPAERAAGLPDADGVSMAEAVTRAGHAPLEPDPEARGSARSSSCTSSRGGRDLGPGHAVGTAIRPHGRWRLDLARRADHAGATRLVTARPDVAFAATVLAARRSRPTPSRGPRSDGWGSHPAAPTPSRRRCGPGWTPGGTEDEPERRSTASWPRHVRRRKPTAPRSS